MMYRLSGGAESIRWNDVRARAEFAGDALEIPRGEVDALIGLSNEALNEDSDILDFCKRHGVSLDWLMSGDTGPLLRAIRLARIGR